MGFETNIKWWNIWVYSLVLKYPYGIWNVVGKDYLRSLLSFEVPLWDLKHLTWHKCNFSLIVLKYPYGIWNESDYADIFELAKVLKYPYGIWNVLIVTK